MASVFRPGDQCGGYEIVRQLGEGGMGEVHLARSSTGEARALKVLSPAAQAKRELAKRFIGEIQVLSYLAHAHVVRFYEAGVEERPEGSVVWLALEFLEGKTLRERLEERGPLDEDSLIRWGRQIAQGVHEAHKLHVVHRDLKPENVVIVGGDTAKVIDFGIAKFRDWEGTRARTSGARIGTLLYMAPEQLDDALGIPIDARTDVYALGVVLYELATGRNPYLDAKETVDMSSLLFRKLTTVLPPVRSLAPALGEDVAGVIDRACQHEARLRHASMAELDDALGAAWRRRMDERRARMLGERDSDGGPPLAARAAGGADASMAPPAPDGQSSRFESVRTLPGAASPSAATRSLRDLALVGAALGLATGLVAYRAFVEPRLAVAERRGARESEVTDVDGPPPKTTRSSAAALPERAPSSAASAANVASASPSATPGNDAKPPSARVAVERPVRPNGASPSATPTTGPAPARPASVLIHGGGEE